jgi:hypothetical protein
VSRIYPGQSSLAVTLGPAEFGAATENEWWGPALRNPIVMSDNAAGFPHGFIRTSHPLNTLLGRFDARWIWGSLEESDYFDVATDDDHRSISALAITWKRRAESGLTLGFTRSVMTALIGDENAFGHFFDALKNVGHPNARSLSDRTMEPGSDQMLSVFARWVLPVYGLESYIEWGRADFPISLRDLMEQPEHSRAYTAGIQWARTLGGRRLTNSPPGRSDQRRAELDLSLPSNRISVYEQIGHSGLHQQRPDHRRGDWSGIIVAVGCCRLLPRWMDGRRIAWSDEIQQRCVFPSSIRAVVRKSVRA